MLRCGKSASPRQELGQHQQLTIKEIWDLLLLLLLLLYRYICMATCGPWLGYYSLPAGQNSEPLLGIMLPADQTQSLST